MDREAWCAPLGYQRLRLLDCLGAHTPNAPTFFPTLSQQDVFSAFGAHMQRLSGTFSETDDRSAQSLLAAGRFLSGDLMAALVIIERFPATPFKLDHGAGYCLVAPLHALATALPLPDELRDMRAWLAGSPQQAAMVAWVAGKQDELRWKHAEGIYVSSDGLASASGLPRRR